MQLSIKWHGHCNPLPRPQGVHAVGYALVEIGGTDHSLYTPSRMRSHSVAGEGNGNGDT